MTPRDEAALFKILTTGGTVYDFLRKYPKYGREEVEFWIGRIRSRYEPAPQQPDSPRKMSGASLLKKALEPFQRKGDEI